MTNKEILSAIEKKYLVPTRKKEREKRIGIEFEFPIVNLSGEPVDFALVHKLTEKFVATFSFSKCTRDTEGNIYCAVSEETGDSLSFDCSYNTLELSFGAEKNLWAIWERFATYYPFLQKLLHEKHHTLTGMGINPNYAVNSAEPIHSQRYRMLYHHLSSFPNYPDTICFHHVPNYGMFSCASQVQLDVTEAQLPEVLNTFSKLEPYKAILFANSYWEERPNYLLNRDYFWCNSMHGLNPHNVGGYAIPFHSTEEILQYIASMSMYCTMRDGVYLNFPPMLLFDYFSAEEITGEYYDGSCYQKKKFHPELADLEHLRSFKFEDLTFRGTVEFRSVCTQPIEEILSTGAFHVGLMRNLSALTELLEQDKVLYGHGYHAMELRELFSKVQFPKFVKKEDLTSQLLRILQLAEDGLRQRGYGEERFLQPLFSRAEQLQSPARWLLHQRKKGKSMLELAEEYGKLEEIKMRIR